MAEDQPSNELAPREPTVEDLRNLCKELNRQGAKYAVIGGFAIRAANYIRATMDIDLLVAAGPENEAKVYAALALLSDNAARELTPGELEKYGVIRVADEIVVDLMKTAGGIAYEEASRDLVMIDVDGVPIPFASPRMLWRMKAVTQREKDAPDLFFLRQWFAERGEEPPRVEGAAERS
jgi:hypothetical protein